VTRSIRNDEEKTMDKLWRRCAAFVLVAAGLLPGAQAQGDGKTEVLWLGQSAFRITTPGGKVIVTDPWLKPNPLTPPEYKNLEALGKVDVLLVTHGHGDNSPMRPRSRS
jgi:glyoxylase-like metal-dependent hydrolase (beta-lactamase superfamily II)